MILGCLTTDKTSTIGRTRKEIFSIMRLVIWWISLDTKAY